MLFKSLEFKNAVGQKLKIIEIPVLEKNNRYYFMIQIRLQIFVSSLYHKPMEKSCYSYRDYLKRKMNWTDFKNLFSVHGVKSNS
ncbi:hypothetical protein BABA_05616 [Neobacillus bataviensis LMG 21833]|uniref:DUF2535 domain-containing protein n=1 Tax=Neobacillus bataviensis LMG 21833 TaxID=1117379 RepID=K6EAD3_9BACI|nr:DUF2535 family protein [Neobacillus bataviensis]EKN70361.1 hypothetical protein BABA_05616 [Neobacillus bataviensis LMG 21833]